MTNKTDIVLLFSGGTDSTYTAVLMKDKYEKVHLITYDRFGFLNTKNSQNSALELKRAFGDDKFIHRIINIDNLFRKISYESYLCDILKYRFFLLSTCGLCKLAMHWQTIIYCLDNGITSVCDGSNQEMITDPSQNEFILEEMRSLYKEFRINYFNPIFNESIEKREKTLFDLGLISVQHPKWTRFSWERQHFCTQEYLFLKFFDFMHKNWRGQMDMEKERKYLEVMFKYHSKKRNFIKKEIYSYLEGKNAKACNI